MDDYLDPLSSGTMRSIRIRDTNAMDTDKLLLPRFAHPETIDQPVTELIDTDRNSTLFDLMSIYYDTIAFENTVGIVIPTIYSFIIFIGLVGNVLVITVVLLNRHMRNSTNMLIVNLAVADLLFLLFCVPFTAADYALPVWVFSYSWCKVLQYLQYVTAYASVWTLVLMAFDRFLAVCLPVQSLTLRTVKNTLFVSGAVWVLIFVLNVPLLQIYGIHRYYFIMEDRESCTFVAQANRTASEFHVQLHHLSFVTWGYLLPLSITCILYFFMLRRLWWGMPARLGSRASEESVRAKKKVTWMVSGVITTFAICWAPLNACFAISALTYRREGEQWIATKTFVIVQFASQILAYANSCLNPILYAFLSDNFRKGFFKICGFLFCCSESKLDFERTNEFGGHGGSAITLAGPRLSATPTYQTGRLSVTVTTQVYSPTYRRKFYQQAKQCESLISEEDPSRKTSADAAAPFRPSSRDSRKRSPPYGIKFRNLAPSGQACFAANGEIVVVYKNQKSPSVEENGKNHKRSISTKVKEENHSNDASEQRLLQSNDLSEAVL